MPASSPVFCLWCCDCRHEKTRRCFQRRVSLGCFKGLRGGSSRVEVAGSEEIVAERALNEGNELASSDRLVDHVSTEPIKLKARSRVGPERGPCPSHYTAESEGEETDRHREVPEYSHR